jgi:hypothetical protein
MGGIVTVMIKATTTALATELNRVEPIFVLLPMNGEASSVPSQYCCPTLLPLVSIILG